MNHQNVSELQGLILDNSYMVLDTFEHGGMSQLYMVRRLRDNLTAVLKLCDCDNTVACESLINEASILSQLSHLPVPQIYDYLTIGKCPAFVMEYIEGLTLNKYISIERFCDVDMIVNICLEICKVVNYMHNIVPPVFYCDMKPSNVIITKERSAILIDFGAVLQYDTGKVIKGTWRKIGTDGYAAPEQMDTYSLIDARTDIYGIGMLMKYMYNVCTKRNHRLEHIISRCTRKDKIYRYSECAELMCDILSLSGNAYIIKKKMVP